MALANSNGNIYLTGQAANDVVSIVHSGSALYTGVFADGDGFLGAGDDTFSTTSANVTTFTGLSLNGNKDADIISFGVLAADVVLGSELYGGQGTDTIFTGALTSSLVNGNKDGDQITVNQQATSSSVFGGQSTDTLSVTGNLTSSLVNGNKENDTITSTGGINFTTSSVYGGQGDDILNISTVGAGTDIFISGDIGDDVVTGAGVATSILGGAGTDNLTGGAAGDTITGGTGTDQITAGGGVDTINVDSGTDTVLDLGNGGADVLSVARLATANATVTVDYVATAGTQNLGTANLTSGAAAVDINVLTTSTATGVLGFGITGSTGGEVLVGSNQADTISGANGADTMTGNAGADQFGSTGTLFGTQGSSVVASANTLAANIANGNTLVFATGAVADTVDRVTNFVAGTDTLDVATAATAPTDLVGFDSTTALVANTTYIAYGQYAANTGTFTIAGGGFTLGINDDAIIVTGNGALDARASTGYQVVQGLNAALGAADFV